MLIRHEGPAARDRESIVGKTAGRVRSFEITQEAFKVRKGEKRGEKEGEERREIDDR